MMQPFPDHRDFQPGMLDPGLYIVATPIGNLSDISIRALKTLASVHIIACEDTRNTGKLLKHFGIKTPMLPYHEHNASRVLPKIMSVLGEGKSVALVSDAGTPLISDPGYKLVIRVRKENVKIIPIPGASSLLTGLVASGLQTDSFLFAGFLPSRKIARQKKLKELTHFPCTLVFFESPNRLSACIEDMANILGGQRKGAICRELTKLHEEILDGSLHDLAENCKTRRIRGEIVIIIGAPQPENIIDIDRILLELLDSMTVSRAVTEATKLTGKPKRNLYQRALQLSNKCHGNHAVE